MPWRRQDYPANWSEIRAAVLARAMNRCETCGKPNGETVHVIMPGGYWYNTRLGENPGGMELSGVWMNDQGNPLSLVEEERLWDTPDSLMPGYRTYQMKVVLTVAHMENPDPMDCRMVNLRAECQHCHLKRDAQLHARNAAITRRRKAREQGGQLDLL